METKTKAGDTESVAILTTADLETRDGKEILNDNINREIDKIFGPAIQRNRSGSDIEIVGPFRRRHYWSQERLFADKPLQSNQGDNILNRGLSSFHIDELKSFDESKNSQTPVLHENQRAEIVASVTERLYSKLKKNDKGISRLEPVLDRKTVQPLSELKICSNARQRLMELSQKALRNKRRIGIPAYTQTRSQVTRVKNQGIEIQSDLQSIIDLNQKTIHILRKDVSIQTELKIPRFKDKAVGSNYDSVNWSNRETAIQTTASYRDNVTMTHIVDIYDHSTQTLRIPQRKKKNVISALKTDTSKIDLLQPVHNVSNNLSPFININISPIYSHESVDSSDSDVFSEEDCESLEGNILVLENTTGDTTPEYRESGDDENEVENVFSDDEYLSLPHVVVDPIRNINDHEELILGRNKDTYPYNLKLSPCKNVDESKRVTKFKDFVDDIDKGNDNSNNRSSCIGENLQLPEQGYLNDEVPKIDSIKVKCIQQSTAPKDENKLGHAIHEAKKFSDMKKYELSSVDNCSPIVLQNEFKPNENESDTSIYYSLNSFFKTRRRKRTPTEYLHYLIQKRREAISMDNSQFYQRNISF